MKKKRSKRSERERDDNYDKEDKCRLASPKLFSDRLSERDFTKMSRLCILLSITRALVCSRKGTTIIR